MTAEKSFVASLAIGLLLMIALVSLPAIPAAAAPPQSTTQASTGWFEDFSGGTLDPGRWIIANGLAPGYIPRNHVGYFQPNRVSFSGGYVVLLLTQERGKVDKRNGIISRGGMIYTSETYGYGTYEWRMRMSSTATSPLGTGSGVSGSVSAGFIYVNNSETEIDQEFAGHKPETLFVTSWLNPDPSTDPTANDVTTVELPAFGINSESRTYKFVWEPGRVTFYVNDVPQATLITNVPSAPAHFMINHWGTNSLWWGGRATVGVSRYFYIDWVRYTPRQ